MKDYSLKINGHQYDVSIDDLNDESTVANVMVNGVPYEVEIVGASSRMAKKPQIVSAPYQVTCPLPGTVISINVKEGDTVSTGQTLAILEAMKMENNIDAAHGGVVKSIKVQAGATVMEGDVLMVIE